MAVTESSIEHLEKRDAAALTEKMSVLDDLERARGAPGIYAVVTESGRQYLVDVETESCTCEDSMYRHPDGGCKHVRRVKFARGDREIPDWAQRDRVDDQLGEHLTEDS